MGPSSMFVSPLFIGPNNYSLEFWDGALAPVRRGRLLAISHCSSSKSIDVELASHGFPSRVVAHLSIEGDGNRFPMAPCRRQ